MSDTDDYYSETVCYTSYSDDDDEEEVGTVEPEYIKVSSKEEIIPEKVINDIIDMVSANGVNSKILEIFEELEYGWTDPEILQSSFEKIEKIYEIEGYLTKNVDYFSSLKNLRKIRTLITE